MKSQVRIPQQQMELNAVWQTPQAKMIPSVGKRGTLRIGLHLPEFTSSGTTLKAWTQRMTGAVDNFAAKSQGL